MANTTNFGWETPDDTDLVKDGAAAMRTLGNSIDASFVDLKGGTTGQVLSKNSNTDLDFTWVAQDDSNAIQNSIVDAKGDLIAASAADTPARLAVGNNGESLVADSSTSTGLRWQAVVSGNYVVNGGMDIWQRGTSSFTADSVYTADRWYLYRGATGKTVTQQTTSLPDGFTYSLRCQRDSGNTATNSIRISQSMENQQTVNLIGKTVVLSFWAKCGANYSPTSSLLLARLITGTGTNQNVISGLTGQADLIYQNATLTTSWQRFSYSATISSSVTQLALDFLMAPTGTASTNDWFEITGVQLEVGSVPSTFRRAGVTLAGELAACQRYYYRNVANGAFTLMTNMGGAETATNCRFIVQHPVTMRVAPTTIEYSTLIVYSPSGGTNSTVSSFSTVYGGAQHSLMTAGVTGLTANASYFLYTNNSTAGYIAFGAEL